jgi:hypothetical protein
MWMQARLTLSEIFEKITEGLPSVDFKQVLPALVARGWVTEFEVIKNAY